MSDQQNWNDIGKQIREAVQGALVTGDFKEMNQIVSQSVNKAVAEAKKQAMAGVKKQTGQAASGAKKQTEKTTFKETKPTTYRAKQLPRIKTKKVGNVAGVLLTVFGGIGTGFDRDQIVQGDRLHDGLHGMIAVFVSACNGKIQIDLCVCR